MKAWVLHGPGDLRFEDVSEPYFADGDREKAIIRVKACGVCGSDIPRIFKTGAHRHPLIPGHEFAGEVVSVTEDTDPSLIGKRVGVFPLIPCKKCALCMDKKYEMCRDYDYLGSRSDGGFAEFVKVPVWNLIELPETVTFETAAMLEPMAVAVHAIRQSGIDKEKEPGKALVIGLGTIGLFVAMFLHGAGYSVTGIGNKEEQKKIFTGSGMGEDRFIRSEDSRNESTARDSLSECKYIFECVGKNESYEQAVSLASPGSTVVTVGNPASDMTLGREIYWKILRNQLTIRGTWNSSFTHEPMDDWHYVLDVLSSGQITPEKMISHRLRLKDLSEGLDIMKDKKEYYTKVMVTEFT